MGLHIEISPGADRREWLGVKALSMIMLGETFLATPDGLTVGIERTDGGPVNIQVDNISASRVEPKATPAVETAVTPAAAIATPPTPPVAAAPPTPPVAGVPAPPPIDPGAIPASESLMAAAAEAARAAVAAGAELDAGGLPWDARIHAGTKTKKADGTWTAKRGAPPELVNAVTAELRAVMAAPVATVPVPPATDTPPSPPAGGLDPAAAFGAGAPAPAPTLAQPIPSDEAAAQTPPAPPVAPSAPAAETPPAGAEAGATPDNITEFARVMKVVVGKQNSGALTTELTTQIVQQLGLPSIRDLVKRPDLIPAFEALLP